MEINAETSMYLVHGKSGKLKKRWQSVLETSLLLQGQVGEKNTCEHIFKE